MPDVSGTTPTPPALTSRLRLVDALGVDRRSAGPSTFLDVETLWAQVTDDDVLYTATRDFAPPSASDASPAAIWRFDRVTWRGPDLATSELKRSLGHWNPPSQLEVFHCTDGFLVLLAAAPHAGATIWVLLCGPGDVAALDGGAWHSTHVTTSEATVENTYLDGHDAGAQHRSHRMVSPRPKYGTHRPLGITVVRAGDTSIDVVNLTSTARRYVIRRGSPIAVLGVRRLTDIAVDRSARQTFEATLGSVHRQGPRPSQDEAWLGPQSGLTLDLSDEKALTPPTR